ncbi:MAG: hypothetical protein JXP73_20330 [Deltaproteobacteria bacterium]|jgi:hypothetical protein|nr:hypothetical protein [Deltaproteobacteria bacterium]
MRKTSRRLLVALALAGCGSDAPYGAVVTTDVTFPETSQLARLQEVSLVRAGDGFVLAGYENGLVRWARVALDGTVAQETSFAMAQPLAGPVFAATMKSSPGDQLVAIALVAATPPATGFHLSATVHTLGTAAPAAPVVLDTQGTITSDTDPSTFRLAAGAAVNGTTGYVAWGTRVKGKPVYYTLLPADAITTAAPTPFLDAPVPANVPEWDCLSAQNHPTGFSFGVVTPGSSGTNSDFQTAEIDESGLTTYMAYPLDAQVMDCLIKGSPVDASTYFIAFEGVKQDSIAIDFATYDQPNPDQDGTVTTYHPVLPAALFGGPLDMPRPAWVSSAGGDVVIGLSRAAGPQVVRYTYNAVPHGSTLPLRSANGQAGPVAAWVGGDAVYATYTDQVKTGSATVAKRYFMRIETPASLP